MFPIDNVPYIFIEKSGVDYFVHIAAFTYYDGDPSYEFIPTLRDGGKFDQLMLRLKLSESGLKTWQTFPPYKINGMGGKNSDFLQIVIYDVANPESGKTTVHYDDPDEMLSNT